jgi:hypothetical protein
MKNSVTCMSSSVSLMSFCGFRDYSTIRFDFFICQHYLVLFVGQCLEVFGVLLYSKFFPRKAPHCRSSNMMPKEDQNTSTPGINDWKKRAPYRIHEPNEHFNALYEANCHCGRVEYQLNREKPLDSKLCHCTTCQTQHGMSLKGEILDCSELSVALTKPLSAPTESTICLIIDTGSF